MLYCFDGQWISYWVLLCSIKLTIWRANWPFVYILQFSTDVLPELSYEKTSEIEFSKLALVHSVWFSASAALRKGLSLKTPRWILILLDSNWNISEGNSDMRFCVGWLLFALAEWARLASSNWCEIELIQFKWQDFSYVKKSVFGYGFVGPGRWVGRQSSMRCMHACQCGGGHWL